jgi:hypothetical protein
VEGEEGEEGKGRRKKGGGTCGKGIKIPPLNILKIETDEIL